MHSRKNSLEDNYILIKQYFRQKEKGLMTAEEYEEKKKALFEDNGWETGYNKLKEKKKKEYRYRAYVALFSLFFINEAISQEEYDCYSKKLLSNYYIPHPSD